MTPTARPLAVEKLLAPRSVAVVGASARAGALGHTVVANLQQLGSTTRVYRDPSTRAWPDCPATRRSARSMTRSTACSSASRSIAVPT